MSRGRPHKCPYCEATKSVAKGFRYNKSGIVKLRRCKACGRRWTTGQAESALEETPSHEGTDANPENTSVVFTPGQCNDNAAPEAIGGQQDELLGREVDLLPEREEEDRLELSLSGERDPSQDDSGEEEIEQSEETFFTQ